MVILYGNSCGVLCGDTVFHNCIKNHLIMTPIKQYWRWWGMFTVAGILWTFLLHDWHLFFWWFLGGIVGLLAVNAWRNY